MLTTTGTSGTMVDTHVGRVIGGREGMVDVGIGMRGDGRCRHWGWGGRHQCWGGWELEGLGVGNLG